MDSGRWVKKDTNFSDTWISFCQTLNLRIALRVNFLFDATQIAFMLSF